MNMKDGTLIFVPRKKLSQLAWQGKWPFGAKYDRESGGWWVPHAHRRYNDSVKKFGNEDAKKIVDDEYSLTDKALAIFRGHQFIHQDDRIYLYIASRVDAFNIKAQYDGRKKMYFISKAREDLEELKLLYLTNEAKLRCLEQQIKTKKGPQKHTSASIQLELFPNAKLSQEKHTRGLVGKKGNKKKEKDALPLVQLIEIVFEDLKELGRITIDMKNKEIIQSVTQALNIGGIEVSYWSVRDIIDQNFLIESLRPKTKSPFKKTNRRP